MAKYKIVPKEVVKNIIEFLDEVQIEAAKGSSVDDLHKINFINWAIGELMNSIDGFDSKNNTSTEEDVEEDVDNDINRKRTDIIDDYFIDWELPDDMTDEEFKEMVTQFDAFLRNFESEYEKKNPKKKPIKRSTDKSDKKSIHRDIVNSMSLKEIEKYLLDDPELSDDDRFQLYYDEREKMRKSKEKTFTYDQILKDLKINPSSPDKKSK